MRQNRAVSVLRRNLLSWRFPAWLLAMAAVAYGLGRAFGDVLGVAFSMGIVALFIILDWAYQDWKARRSR